MAVIITGILSLDVSAVGEVADLDLVTILVLDDEMEMEVVEMETVSGDDKRGEIEVLSDLGEVSKKLVPLADVVDADDADVDNASDNLVAARSIISSFLKVCTT